ncbi:hypothetical protein LCGC14_0365930 [marine sediment metagenome]|uniref:VRR-NUC domain-containing protein n=1 Tax=marine sediment metagenome TaxID=412755 RepID=A0A0F9VU08_9ZZZZ
MPTATEQAFADKMVAEGWEVYHNGFPDFLCKKGDEVILVEVKSSSKEIPRESQYQILRALDGSTPTAFVWSPDVPNLRAVSEQHQRKILENEGSIELFGNSTLPVALAGLVCEVLHKKDGKTYQEIAGIFGVSYETIRREILKAKQV